MAKLLIWDLDGAPPVSDTICVFWSKFITFDKQEIISIPRLVEDNAEPLRQRFLCWIFELGETKIQGKTITEILALRPGFSYWWMSLLAEKCNVSKSPQIDDAIKLLAFDGWARDHTIDQVQLLSTDKKLCDCLKLWCKKKGIKFVCETKPIPVGQTSWLQSLYAVLPYGIQALFWLLKYLLERWKLKGIGKKEWSNSAANVTFVSYFANMVPDAFVEGRFESRYWTNLTNALFSKGIKTNWLHLYMRDTLVTDTGKAARALQNFNKMGSGLQHHVMLDSFLSPSIVIKIIRDWFRMYRHSRGLESVASLTMSEGVSLWPLFKEDWRQSMGGKTAVSNAWHFNLFERAMQVLPKQRLSIYLQENMDWEFAFLWAWKFWGHGRSIGFPHSTIRFWDLRYFFDFRSYQQSKDCPMPMPDKIAVNGPLARASLMESGFADERIIEVESLRYLYLEDMLEKRRYRTGSNKKKKMLLVLGDFQPAVNIVLMRFLEEAAPYLPAYIEIAIKPHPLCPIITEDYPALTMSVKNESIETSLLLADVAYTGSMTSAVVDAYLFGIPVVSVLDNDRLNLSPMRGKAGVSFVSSTEDLVKALSTAFLPVIEGSQVQDIFYLDKKLPRWKKALSDK